MKMRNKNKLPNPTPSVFAYYLQVERERVSAHSL
jgi:hypothetical protein